MASLIAYALLSIVFSFLCSIWEAVLLSVTPSYIQRQLKQGTNTGKLFAEYKEDVDRPLSAILTLNTIAHTVGAIMVGAQAGQLYGSNSVELFGFHLTYEAIIAGVMTLAILILSEIIPKTIGANYWERLAPFTARSLRILLIILAPLVTLSTFITRGLSRNKKKSVLSPADITAMVEVGEKDGTIDQAESRIIKNMFALRGLAVEDIMTPRTVLFSVQQDMTLSEFYAKHKDIPFSRFPIYKDRPDQVTGMVLKDDILTALLEDNANQKMTYLSRPISFVENTTKLPALFDNLVDHRNHMSVVNDRFGSLVGLVTMEDLFETILGIEIVDESDSVEDMQRLARQRWEARHKE